MSSRRTGRGWRRSKCLASWNASRSTNTASRTRERGTSRWKLRNSLTPISAAIMPTRASTPFLSAASFQRTTPPSAPGRLIPSTIIPAFMEKGSVHIGFGIMGGLNQPQAHAQFVSNVVDYGMNIQWALEAPRFTKLDFGGCDFMIEGRVPEAVRQALTALGHKLEVRGDFSTPMGGGQAVIHDSSTGVNYGASSPRKDGAPIPEPDPHYRSQ